MDWSRLGVAILDALLVSLVVGTVLSPPDPFTQLLYALPALLVTVPVVYRFGQQSVSPWWRRYLVFVGGVVVLGLAWQLLAFAAGLSSSSAVRPAFLLAGITFGAWLAYFGGLERIRGGVS